MATRNARPVSPALADPGIAPLATLPGVGPALVASLGKLGLTRVQDLWFHLPLRYEDKTRITAIADLRAGERAQVEGVVAAVDRGFRHRPQHKTPIGDARAQTLPPRPLHSTPPP